MMSQFRRFPFRGTVAFERTWERDGIRYAAMSHVAVDLLTSPGRGRAEGEALPFDHCGSQWPPSSCRETRRVFGDEDDRR
jgi:hypothetical protein